MAKEYIEREAAIDAIYDTFQECRNKGMAASVLSDVPAADVRPVVRGRWKKVGSIFPMYECDQCHAITLGGNFCPNCGAKMDALGEE